MGAHGRLLSFIYLVKAVEKTQDFVFSTLLHAITHEEWISCNVIFDVY